MLIAGIVPGLILAVFYILYILYVSYAHPERVPQSRRERVPFATKLRSIKGVIFPIILVILILGSIFFGIATPTEAAAVGVAGAFIIGMLKRKLNYSGIRHATFETAKATTMILWITIGAKAMSLSLQAWAALIPS